MERKRNHWKQAFFILLGIVIMSLASLLSLIFSEPEAIVKESEAIKNKPTLFTLTANKSSINQWIDEELSKKKQKVNNIYYEVVLEDHIILKGYLLVFNRELPFQMVFEPSVEKRGGLTLNAKEIRIGKLKLPGEIVLQLMADQMNFPEWVTVQPMEHLITVDVSKIRLDNGLQIAVKTFDLKNDRLVFDVFST